MDNFKLNFFLVCDQIIVAQESNNVSLINIFNEVRTNGFPSIHPHFSVISNTSGPVGNFKQEVEVIDPDGNSLAKVIGNTDYSGAGPNNFIANFSGFVFPKAGVYTFKVKIEDTILSEKAAFITVKLSS